LAFVRPTPFDVAFGPEAEERFARMRASLEGARLDADDLDAFVLDREVVSFLRELVPEEGVGEAVTRHLALLHHAFLYWREGGWIFRLTRDRSRDLLAGPPAVASADVQSLPPRAYYVQLPERLIWAEVAEGEPHQPLDGLFVRPWPSGGYFALAVFGMHPGHSGFTLVEAEGYPEEDLARADGSPPFGPVLPGGAAAGLFSIVAEEELLELAARTVPLAREARACIGARHHPHQAVEVG
jgi:hypothetical protein